MNRRWILVVAILLLLALAGTGAYFTWLRMRKDEGLASHKGGEETKSKDGDGEKPKPAPGTNAGVQTVGGAPLRDWRQQGPAANGKWALSKEGAEVVTTEAGKPTFFVSPDDHINTTIKCTIRVDPGKVANVPWWDHAGLVFGYRSPVADTGDKDNQFEFLLLKWSGRSQLAFNDPPNGFFLVRVKGTFDKGYDKLWRTETAPECELLGHRKIEGTGEKGVEHAFELRYEEERIKITVNGKPLFDVKGKFAPGRFGFYNFGQPNVHYYGFSAQPGK